jgi:hypothetical protein
MTAVGACAGAFTPAALSTLDTQTVTVGGSGTIPDDSLIRGFSVPLTYGSISDGTSNIYGGAAITALFYDMSAGGITMSITGTLANSGWTTLTIKSTVLNRADAFFSVSGGVSYWFWASGGTTTFGSLGTNATCTFA